MFLSFLGCLYVCAAVALAWCACRTCLPQDRGSTARIAILWFLLTPALFFLQSQALFMLFAAFLLLVLAPRAPLQRITFYCAVLPAVPAGIIWYIPFPGLVSLYILEYSDLLALVVLLPIAFSKPGTEEENEQGQAVLRTILALACAYLVLVSLLDFRLTTFTNGMRRTVGHLIGHGLLILALVRICRRKGAFDAIAIGFLLGTVFVLGVSFAQVLSGWFMYAQVSDNLRLAETIYVDFVQERGAGLRIFGTMSPIVNGMYMAMGILLTGLLVSLGRVQRISLLLLPLFLYILYRTDARGALLMLLVCLLIAVFYAVSFRKYRTFAFVLGIPCVLGFLLFSDIFMQFVESDEHGTFQYRWGLLLATMEAIAQYPFFGTPDFELNPVLQAIRVEGDILDITNSYAQQGLRYGLTGLLLFVAMLGVIVRALIRLRRHAEVTGDVAQEQRSRITLALIVGYGCAIVTVSLISALFEFYWLLIFLGVCCFFLGQQPLQKGAGAERGQANGRRGF
jgi:hypothetical protein